MNFRDWNEYQHALASYRLACQQHLAERIDWDSGREALCKSRLTTPALLLLLLAWGLAFAFRPANAVFEWLTLSSLFFALGALVARKHQARRLERYLRETPKPFFSASEPRFIPPAGASHRTEGGAPHDSPRTGNYSDLDCLAILGLGPGATRATIKAAYRKKMAGYHPDKVAHLGEDLRALAEAKAKEINLAYEQLLQRRGDDA